MCIDKRRLAVGLLGARHLDPDQKGGGRFMFYGVEQSTDLRNPQTVVKKFRSKSQALRWRGEPGKSGRSTFADPEGARNWHHTFRRVYELVGKVDRKHPVFKDRGTSTYPRCDADNLASYLYLFGEEVNP